MKELEVKIPIQFKQGILERFDAKSIKKIGDFFRIPKSCELCEKYRQKQCKKCPLNSMKEGGKTGCMVWIRRVLKKEGLYIKFYVSKLEWLTNDNKKARKELNDIRKGIMQFIEWV